MLNGETCRSSIGSHIDGVAVRIVIEHDELTVRFVEAHCTTDGVVQWSTRVFTHRHIKQRCDMFELGWGVSYILRTRRSHINLGGNGLIRSVQIMQRERNSSFCSRRRHFLCQVGSIIVIVENDVIASSIKMGSYLHVNIIT